MAVVARGGSRAVAELAHDAGLAVEVARHHLAVARELAGTLGAVGAADIVRTLEDLVRAVDGLTALALQPGTGAEALEA